MIKSPAVFVFNYDSFVYIIKAEFKKNVWDRYETALK